MQQELLDHFNEESADQRQIQVEPLDILDRLSNPFFSLDIDARINYLNKKAAGLFHGDPDTLIGRSIDELPACPLLHGTICRAYRQAIAGQQGNCLETHCREHNLWFEHHIHPSEGGLSVYITDITAKKKREMEQLQINERLLNLSTLMETIREEEKISLAREIHDELGQQLTVLIMDVSWLEKCLEKDDEYIRDKITCITELLDKAVETIRKISTTLHPAILDDLGLTATLEWQSLEFKKRTDIPVQFQFQETGLSVPSNVAICLFRIYQESLTNIARHAGAQKVTAALEWKEEGISLCISDDGRGFDMDIAGYKRRHGLTGMKERTMLLGGRCEITSQPGKGTTIKIFIPLRNQFAKPQTSFYDPYCHCG